MQKQLDQAKKDLETAKSTSAVPASATPVTAAGTATDVTPSAPLSDNEREILEKKIKELEDEQVAYNEVSLSNQSVDNR